MPIELSVVWNWNWVWTAALLCEKGSSYHPSADAGIMDTTTLHVVCRMLEGSSHSVHNSNTYMYLWSWMSFSLYAHRSFNFLVALLTARAPDVFWFSPHDGWRQNCRSSWHTLNHYCCVKSFNSVFTELFNWQKQCKELMFMTKIADL